MGRILADASNTKKAEILRSHYRVARMSLFAAIVFSVLNCIFTFFDNIFYSAFSFSFPLAMIDNARFWTGMMYSPEEYMQQFNMTKADMLHPDFLFVDGGFALAVIILAVVCWIFSKKQVGWLIGATALVGADVLFMIYWYDFSFEHLTQYVMSGGLIAILVLGIVAHYRLRVMEWTGKEFSFSASPRAGSGAEQEPDAGQAHPDSPVLHERDFSVKSKILMIYDVQGYTICCRRVGNVNELVINKMVYDVIDTGRHEQPHELCAWLDGHEIVVGLSVGADRYICFDGEVVKKESDRN